MKPPVVANISFFPNPRLEKEDLRGTYGECSQKSIIESDHNDRINYSFSFLLHFLVSFSIAIFGLLYNDFSTFHFPEFSIYRNR